MARPLFQRLKAGRLLLEYDDERSGDFEPLRHVPEDKTVVLGLITTKSPKLESQDQLLERLQRAARYVPPERLALSTQCGFSTSIVGNRITAEDQKRKLRLVVETAGKFWG
ncbi:MAG: vitamin-B12 independent methionine synthase [Acidobacteriota bacterium]